MTSTQAPPAASTLDRRGRSLGDLRVSLTDRCNFRCTYCMPTEAYPPGTAFLPARQLLSAAEIGRLVGSGVRHGVTKVRLTGGEPLLRRDVIDIVRAVAATGVRDLAMTTNGSLLARHATALRDAGLHRLTVSLDSLDPDVVARISGGRARLDDILAGIDAAEQAGFAPLKINCVVRRGVNDAGVAALAQFGRARGHIVRFIEFMDVGATNQWVREDVVPAADILAQVSSVHPVDRLPPAHHGEVAQRYAYRDGSGEVGVIASVSEPFCGACTRLRVSADGHLFTCLFATSGADVRPLLRDPSDTGLDDFLARLWGQRSDAYSEERGGGATRSPLRRIEMSYIGG